MKEKLTDSIDTWVGKNIFYLNGKFLGGPTGFKQIILASTIILVPIALFLIFDSNWYTENLSIAVPILGALLYLLLMIFMIITSFSDPGILPRKMITKQNENQTNEGFFILRKFKVIDLGYYRLLKVCESCGIVRPFRSNHCADCDNCVERFDHHCPWLGCCIAKRNYKNYFIFVVICNLLIFYLVGFSLFKIIQSISNKLKTNQQSVSIIISRTLLDHIISIFLIIYGLSGTILVGGLLYYHTRIVINNLTTKEDMKGFYENAFGNPYFKKSLKYRLGQSFCPKQSHPTVLEVIRMNYEKTPKGFKVKNQDELQNDEQEYNIKNDCIYSTERQTDEMRDINKEEEIYDEDDEQNQEQISFSNKNCETQSNKGKINRSQEMESRSHSQINVPQDKNFSLNETKKTKKTNFRHRIKMKKEIDNN